MKVRNADTYTSCHPEGIAVQHPPSEWLCCKFEQEGEFGGGRGGWSEESISPTSPAIPRKMKIGHVFLRANWDLTEKIGLRLQIVLTVVGMVLILF
eukprot:CCRYP_005994-RB/>CCRYP_005994-RB protein AED:0.47 eAED:0.47 QI:0/0.5/0.33/1/0/0/3/223/95